MGREIAFRRLGETIVVAIGAVGSIGDAEFDRYIREMNANLEQKGVCEAMFTFSPTTAPTPMQRQRLREAVESFGVKHFAYNVFIADSALVRGAITALNWFTTHTQVHAFHSSDLGRACDWLADTGHHFDRAAVFAALSDLLREVGYSDE